MKTTIRYYVRSVYGQERIYLADSNQAQTVATLTRRKTVERQDLMALITLGCDVLQVSDPRSWLAPSNVSALKSSFAEWR